MRVGLYLFIFFLDGLDAGSQHCLASNNKTILLGVLACLSDTTQPPPGRPSYLWGWMAGAPSPLCTSVTLMVGSQPSSWEVVPPVTLIRALVYCVTCVFKLDWTAPVYQSWCCCRLNKTRFQNESRWCMNPRNPDWNKGVKTREV